MITSQKHVMLKTEHKSLTFCLKVIFNRCYNEGSFTIALPSWTLSTLWALFDISDTFKVGCFTNRPAIKVKFPHYRPGVSRRIALLFHDSSIRRGWVVSSMPRPHFTPGKDPVPIVQEAGWAPGPVWTGGKSCPHWDLIPDCPARSQSIYWLNYPAHNLLLLFCFDVSADGSDWPWD